MGLEEMTFVYDIGGAGYNRKATSRVYLDVAVPILDADRVTLAETARASWATGGVDDVLPVTSVLDHVEVTSVVHEANPEYDPAVAGSMPFRVRRLGLPNLSTGAAVPGVDAGDAYPPQTAWVVTLRTARAGRSYRGRVYLPPISSTRGGVDGETTQLFADDVAAAFENVMQDVEAALVPIDVDHVIVSNASLGGVAPPVIIPPEEVTQYTCRKRVDTQRRRLRREL